MSAEQPVNPHVLSLHYRVAKNDAVNYRTAERTVHHRDGFDVVMDDGQVSFEFRDHYPDEVSARAAVRDYIEEWEFQADLSIGAGYFRLEFIRAEIVDRDPVLGDRRVPSWVTLASIRFPAIPAVVDYPVPPAETTVEPEDTLFAAMRQRYEAYSRDSAALTAIAYFCLTCLEQMVPQGRSRKAAAALYDIPYRDLQRVGSLAGRKGGQQGARKAKAIESDLTDEETAFLVDMVKLMIPRRGEVAALPHDGGPTVSSQTAAGHPPCEANVRRKMLNLVALANGDRVHDAGVMLTGGNTRGCGCAAKALSTAIRQSSEVPEQVLDLIRGLDRRIPTHCFLRTFSQPAK